LLVFNFKAAVCSKNRISIAIPFLYKVKERQEIDFLSYLGLDFLVFSVNSELCWNPDRLIILFLLISS